MAGETNLDKLLKSMEPELSQEQYIFCTFKDAQYGDYTKDAPWAVITEREGLTFIFKKEIADKGGFQYEGVFKRITLQVHSSLDAVGLTAAVSAKLAEKGISANVIAAFYHDHVFVQTEKAEKAMLALKEFQS